MVEFCTCLLTHTHVPNDDFDDDENSNYQQIQSLAFDQHEIATETISLQQGLQDKGYEEWVGEMIGMREILRHFANVSTNDVVGMRAPYLKPGRNAQYKVRIFSYTISIISRRRSRQRHWSRYLCSALGSMNEIYLYVQRCFGVKYSHSVATVATDNAHKFTGLFMPCIQN